MAMKNKSVRLCPACDGGKRRLLGEKNGFEVFECTNCLTLYTGHVPLSDESQDYDEYYSECNLSVPNFIKQRVGEILRGFDRYRQSNRLLDIGFGAGTVLEIAEKQSWQVCGLEVSRPAFEHAKERGFEVFYGGLREAGYPDGHFDVITASEILEHLPDPVSDLREIVRILRPGGLFWATTPSARALSFRLLNLKWSVLSPPEHIQLYSRKGAALMLRAAGFEKIRFKTFGLNPAEIAEHYRKREADSTVGRVQSGYVLNESLTRSPLRRLLKKTLNESLNLFSVGDSLKIYAETK